MFFNFPFQAFSSSCFFLCYSHYCLLYNLSLLLLLSFLVMCLPYCFLCYFSYFLCFLDGFFSIFSVELVGSQVRNYYLCSPHHCCYVSPLKLLSSFTTFVPLPQPLSTILSFHNPKSFTLENFLTSNLVAISLSS